MRRRLLRLVLGIVVFLGVMAPAAFPQAPANTTTVASPQVQDRLAKLSDR